MECVHLVCGSITFFVTVVLGVNGIMKCLCRGVAGALLDRIKFNKLMPVITALLTVLLLSVFFIG